MGGRKVGGWSLTLVGGGRWEVGLKNKWEVGSEIGGRCTLNIGGGWPQQQLGYSRLRPLPLTPHKGTYLSQYS